MADPFRAGPRLAGAAPAEKEPRRPAVVVGFQKTVAPRDETWPTLIGPRQQTPGVRKAALTDDLPRKLFRERRSRRIDRFQRA